MAAKKGRMMLIKVSDGTSPGTFSTLGGIRSKTITINNEQVDITTDDEAPWRILLGNVGLRSVAISGSGVFQDDAAINTLEDFALSGGIEDYQIVFENGDIIQGRFQVASFEYSGEHTAEQTFSLSLESAGTVNMLRA